MVDKCGKFYSYEDNPVAKIFFRDHGNATDMKSIAKLMRSNFYKADPFSDNNPRNAVGSRGDIESEVREPAPIGVTDTKIYSNENAGYEPNATRDGLLNNSVPLSSFQIKAGPPFCDSWNEVNRTEVVEYGEDDQAGSLGPFIWPESEFREDPHRGHPDKWDFEPLVIF